MKNYCCVFVLCLLCVTSAFSQADTNRTMVKYTRDFKFQDGIFMSFNEFKNNAPSIKKFEAIKDKNSSDESAITLRFTQSDSLGKTTNMVVQNCFGFAKNGVLFFGDGNYGYYRMFIVGALSHIMAYQHNTRYYDDYYSNPSALTFTSNDITEYVLDFETGAKIVFTYRNFKDFLKTHDAELLLELEKSKNKREMIHHFLLKYNEKHPVYFPSR
jgi:hypothetical protein